MSGTSGMGFQPAHDTGLYDPEIHDNQIVAMYETDAQARAAQSGLVSAGIASSAIKIVARGNEGGMTGAGASTDEGVWGSIKSLFVPDEDRTAYSHAVGRGHAMLVVTPTSDMDRTTIIRTLEATDPLDFDARLEEWRQEGYDTSTAHGDYMASSTTGPSKTSAMSGSGIQGTAMGAGTAGTASTGTTGMAGAAGAGTANLGTASFGTAAASTTGAHTGANQDTIKVMEEQLRVGKREVANGAVRIRSYVVERPVEEKVTLHDERVTVDRTPVNRAATPAEMGAFQERTIEARATSEEAVVSKEARVVEEIGLHKEASDRTETVRDTVRRTEVEIEGDTAAKTGTLTNKTGTTTPPVATPGATSSGANAPRR